MLYPLLIAAALVAATVMIHASGFTLMLRTFSIKTPKRPWQITWQLIQVAWALIAMHMLGIILWGGFYWYHGCLPDLESALYFSGITYTSIGYGDLVLVEPWRLLSPIQGLVGILMCGLSAGAFFALASRIYAAQRDPEDR